MREKIIVGISQVGEMEMEMVGLFCVSCKREGNEIPCMLY